PILAPLPPFLQPLPDAPTAAPCLPCYFPVDPSRSYRLNAITERRLVVVASLHTRETQLARNCVATEQRHQCPNRPVHMKPVAGYPFYRWMDWGKLGQLQHGMVGNRTRDLQIPSTTR
ncbi:hypothetical protein ElyMa_003311300, partial [Elysia marginata]